MSVSHQPARCRRFNNNLNWVQFAQFSNSKQNKTGVVGIHGYATAATVVVNTLTETVARFASRCYLKRMLPREIMAYNGRGINGQRNVGSMPLATFAPEGEGASVRHEGRRCGMRLVVVMARYALAWQRRCQQPPKWPYSGVRQVTESTRARRKAMAGIAMEGVGEFTARQAPPWHSEPRGEARCATPTMSVNRAGRSCTGGNGERQ